MTYRIELNEDEARILAVFCRVVAGPIGEKGIVRNMFDKIYDQIYDKPRIKEFYYALETSGMDLNFSSSGYGYDSTKLNETIHNFNFFKNLKIGDHVDIWQGSEKLQNVMIINKEVDDNIMAGFYIKNDSFIKIEFYVNEIIFPES